MRKRYQENMWYQQNSQFNELAEACGNRFLAVKYLAKTARALSKNMPRYALESKLITWALTGEEPDFSNIYKRFYCENPDVAYLKTYISYIDDKEVRYAITEMYQHSIQEKHICYECSKQIDEFKLARSRILLRMMWYEYNM